MEELQNRRVDAGRTNRRTNPNYSMIYIVDRFDRLGTLTEGIMSCIRQKVSKCKLDQNDLPRILLNLSSDAKKSSVTMANEIERTIIFFKATCAVVPVDRCVQIIQLRVWGTKDLCPDILFFIQFPSFINSQVEKLTLLMLNLCLLE